MARSKPNDFENRYFEMLAEWRQEQARRNDKQDEVQAQILEQVRYTNGRVNRHDEEIKKINRIINKTPTKKELPAFLSDVKFLTVLVLFLLTVSATIAKLVGVDITRFL